MTLRKIFQMRRERGWDWIADPEVSELKLNPCDSPVRVEILDVQRDVALIFTPLCWFARVSLEHTPSARAAIQSDRCKDALVEPGSAFAEVSRLSSSAPQSGDRWELR